MSLANLMRDWRSLRGCLYASPDELMPESPDDDRAVFKYCSACPVAELCLETALATGSRDGIWGGMSETQRAPLHDERDKQRNSLVQRLKDSGPKLGLSLDDKLELLDLRDARVQKSRVNRELNRAYHLRLGELYCLGIDKQELIALRPPLMQADSFERILWRAISTYRAALSAEITSQSMNDEFEPLPQALQLRMVSCPNSHHTPAQRRLLRLRKRAGRNFLIAAESASSEAGKAYWTRRAAKV